MITTQLLLLIPLDFGLRAQEKINADKKIRFFKTHNILGAINKNKFTNIKNTIGCIYIVRDPTKC